MLFKEKLKEEIAYQGLLLKEVADRAGISKRTLDSYVDSRSTTPPVDVAVKLAKVLNVSVEYLVTGEEKSLPKEYTKFLKYRDILEDISIIPDEILNPIKAMIHTAAETVREKNVPKVSSH